MYQPRVYLAGPIQHAQDHGKGWRNRIKSERDEFNWVDPFDQYDTKNESQEWTSQEIIENDFFMIDNCRALLVHWEEVPTCGTPMEIRYAYENDIFVVVQTKINQDDLSPWLKYHVDSIVESFDQAILTLQHALWCDR